MVADTSPDTTIRVRVAAASWAEVLLRLRGGLRELHRRAVTLAGEVNYGPPDGQLPLMALVVSGLVPVIRAFAGETRLPQEIRR